LLNSFARQSFITPERSTTSTSRMTIIYTRGAADELFKTAQRCSSSSHDCSTMRVLDSMSFERPSDSDISQHCRCKFPANPWKPFTPVVRYISARNRQMIFVCIIDPRVCISCTTYAALCYRSCIGTTKTF